MLNKTLIALGAILLASPTLRGAECDRVVVELISSSQPGLREPGDAFNEFDGPDDHGIYFSAADWISDPDAGEYVDGLVDLNFGMNFANTGTQPGGFDRQVKQIQEYRMLPAYNAGITSTSLVSATLEIVVDDVLDMSLSGASDVVAPEWIYINVFPGDGLLISLADAQLDFDRCDRSQPLTWDVVFHFVSSNGVRISDDEIDENNGEIVLRIDVTDALRTTLATQPDFAGFSMAGSADGDNVLVSVDGGSGTFAQLPRLILVGPALGDFDNSNTVDLVDFSALQRCFTGDGVATTNGCTVADLDQDTDVDNTDLALLADNLFGPDSTCATEPELRGFINQVPRRALSQPAVRTPRFFGDFNGDGDLNVDDRAHFEACYENSGDRLTETCRTADLTRDGRVDDKDLRLFEGIFTR